MSAFQNLGVLWALGGGSAYGEDARGCCSADKLHYQGNRDVLRRPCQLRSYLQTEFPHWDDITLSLFVPSD